MNRHMHEVVTKCDRLPTDRASDRRALLIIPKAKP